MMFERMELNWFFRSALRCEMARIRSFSSLFFFLTWGSKQQSAGNKQMVAKCNT
jgi:hypothetical protein